MKDNSFIVLITDPLIVDTHFFANQYSLYIVNFTKI